MLTVILSHLNATLSNPCNELIFIFHIPKCGLDITTYEITTIDANVIIYNNHDYN